MDYSNFKIIWMISEKGDRTFWTKIGIGNVNKDGSITLHLDAIPTGTSKLQLRDYSPRENDQGDGRERNRPASMRSSSANVPTNDRTLRDEFQ
jgi:hypothetical protein